MNESSNPFESSPLITPERLARDAEEALALAPNSIHLQCWPEDPAELASDGIEPVIVIAIGAKHDLVLALSPAQAALLFEICRFGHTLVTNSNHGTPPRIYPRLMFKDAPEDMQSLSRLFAHAAPHEAVSQKGGLPSDFRVENLTKTGAGKPTKDGFQTTYRHVESAARLREIAGTLPPHFDVDAYLANVRALFDLMRKEDSSDAQTQAH